jgi:hypothetical protein
MKDGFQPTRFKAIGFHKAKVKVKLSLYQAMEAHRVVRH